MSYYDQSLRKTKAVMDNDQALVWNEFGEWEQRDAKPRCYWCRQPVPDAQLQRHTDPQQPLSCGSECVAKRGPDYEAANPDVGPVFAVKEPSHCEYCRAQLGNWRVGFGRNVDGCVLCDRCASTLVLSA
jgi:hypothetical protein